MAHIFISYSRAERSVAAKLAERLTEAGYDVWWDAALLGGSRFEDEINLVLAEAPVAIILWSNNSAASDWVRAEAEVARKRKSAVPVLVDAVPIATLPILYQQIHIIDLKDWAGDTSAPGYAQILKAVVGRLGVHSGPTLTSTEAQAKLSEDADEAAVWADIVGAKDVGADDYKHYLKRYGPKGRFAAIAQLRIARLDRRARGRLLTVGGAALGAVLVVASSAVLLRPDLLGWTLGQRQVVPVAALGCPADQLAPDPIVPISVCVDSRVWHSTGSTTNPNTYRTADELYYFMFRGGTKYITADSYLPSLIKVSDGQATTVAPVVVSSKTTQSVGGEEWSVWDYQRSAKTATDGVDFVESNRTYYYAKPGFGWFEMTIWTNQATDTVQPFGDKLFQSIQFK